MASSEHPSLEQPSSPQIDAGQETSYVYIKTLGCGAFAEANLYRKVEDNTLVVWKEINMARLGDKECRDAINEIEILFLLNHANIITYYNHFMDGDTLLIELEYANGGTLSDKLLQQKDLLDENVVKWYLYQLTSALAHCHENSIIHRDVKSLNVFTTKTDLLKLGDFGISKVLESSSQLAETVAGTPLYMSPELMQGFKYDYKTDIWALGCVLYELLTLTRTFHATNQLRLAFEVVNREHGDISPKYTIGMKQLVDSMLRKAIDLWPRPLTSSRKFNLDIKQHHFQNLWPISKRKMDPKDRPSAEEILQNDVLSDRENFSRKVYELNSVSRKTRLQSLVSVTEQTVVPVVKSKVTEVYQWGGGKVVPQKQDMFVKGKSAAQVSAGQSHFAVVTLEKELYTWANLQGGSKIVGQLGHGNNAAYKTPKKVESVEDVIQADCGEEFTVCLTGEGDVYSFGSDFYGCLGCNNEEGDEVLSPVRLEYFSRLPVQEISCGDNHVVALTRDGDVFTWGCGEFGRLGLGNEDDFSSPQKAETAKKHLIKHVYGGPEGTFLLTTTGRVLACGSNEHNKLGFNSETSGLKKRKPKVYDIPCKLTFSLVRPLTRLNVMNIATGSTHSAVIDICGHLYTFGSNKYGQLGVGDFKNHQGICRVPGVMVNHRVQKVTCGDGFTVASTSDNYVYAWGNGENGRLASVLAGDLDLGKGPNGQSVAIPRPVFGALHIIPYLSASHWHTILIAEKVISQKTLNKQGSAQKMKKVDFKDQHDTVSIEAVEVNGANQSYDSAFSNDHQTDNKSLFVPSPSSLDSTADSGKPVSPDDTGQTSLSPKVHMASTEPGNEEQDETGLPPWLEAELDDDFIPIPQDFVIQAPIQPPVESKDSMVTKDGFQWKQTDVPELKLDIPSYPLSGSGSYGFQPSEDNKLYIQTLQDKISELELENKKMRADKDNIIEILQKKIVDLDTENNRLKEQLKKKELLL